MTSASATPDTSPPVGRAEATTAAGHIRRVRGSRGFSLLEVLIAFAILAITLALMTESQVHAVNLGAKALDLRDVRSAADTVFRKFIYEIGSVNDGDSAGLDTWYAEYIGLRGQQRDRWAVYRGVVHKQRGIAAGTDPTGKAQPLFEGQGSGSSSTSGSGTSGTGGASGTGGTGGSTEPSAPEEVYMLTLEVFQGTEDAEPVMKLRTIVPIPDGELETDK